MDKTTQTALATDRVIDITTFGRKSGDPRRIEIWIHEADGRYFITGRPGRRSWYSNLLADPRLIVHLKVSATADLPGRARALTEAQEKAAVLRSMPRLREIVTEETLPAWVAGAPLVEVTFD